jgi:hypothetical protein
LKELFLDSPSVFSSGTRPTEPCSRKTLCEKGTALIEFAIVAPLLLMFTFAVVDIGNCLLHHEALTLVIREVARQNSWTPRLERGTVIAQDNGSGGMSCSFQREGGGSAASCDVRRKYWRNIVTSWQTLKNYEVKEHLRVVPDTRRIEVHYPDPSDPEGILVDVGITYDALMSFQGYMGFIADRPIRARFRIGKM